MIVAFVEQSDGRPDQLSLEMLALAARLGAEGHGAIHAVLFGDGAADAAATLSAHGVVSASVVTHQRLDDYAPVAWASSLRQVMAESFAEPGHGCRQRARQRGAGLRRRAGRAAHGRQRDRRPQWSAAGHHPAALGRQPPRGRLARRLGRTADGRAARGRTGSIGRARGSRWPSTAFVPALSDADLQVRVTSRVAPDAGRISLTDARVVVGGGRGVGGAEGFAALEELAGLLGGAVGVSRAVTSAGWRPHAEQIGQTGLRIAPDLYIACGISGAIQHIVGCKAAKHILAINNDPDSPIMEKATYAVIGDLRTIVPAISAEIRRSR